MSDKNKQEIQLKFSQVTALDNQKLEAFNNAFSYHDDTYFHKSIGSLFGIIQVLDQSEQSEYIPNLLTSIIKKEFYSQPKRPTEESFEVALKKANLALADLAEHDIVNWNGQLHALIGVFNDNTLYFTQVGNASIFLGRDKKLLNLSENSSYTPVHPVKTFNDVVVGEIKDQDKIIITSPTIYNIFKFNDLARLFNTFNSEEFDNLIIKTLEKEAVNTTTIIVNIEQKNPKPIVKTTNEEYDDSEESKIEELTKNKNFLGEEIKKTKKATGQSNKKKQKTTKKNDIGTNQDNKPRVSNVPLETPASAKFPKKKTVQTTNNGTGSSISNEKESTFQEIDNNKTTTTSKTTSSPKKKTSKIKNALLNKSTITAKNAKNKIKKLDGVKPKKEDSPKKDLSPFEKTPEIYISDNDENIKKPKKKIAKKKLRQFFSTPEKKTKQHIKNSIKKEIKKDKPPLKKKRASSSKIKTDLKEIKTTNKQGWLKKFYPSSVKNKLLSIKKIFKKNIQNFLTKLKNNSKSPHGKIGNYLKKYPETIGKNVKNKIIAINFKNFNFTKITNFLKTNYVIVGLIIFLILVPLIVFQITKHHQKNKIKTIKESVPTIARQTTTEPTIKDLTPVQIIATLPENIKIISGNNDLLIAQSQSGKIYEISSDNKITNIDIPKNIKLNEIKSIAYMSSLNLFFFTSDSQVLSYSPVTHKFYKNKIALPSQFNLIAQGTYLDYLYLLDKTSKQIYRYPRDTGGFGKPKTWLKTPLPTTDGLIDMAIDDTIRLAYKNGKIETYFKNKITKSANLSIEQLNDIYTNTTLSNYYILNQKTGKILRISKDTDQITKEYQNKKITKTTNIFVNETIKKIYFLDDKNINSIDL